MGNLGSQGSTAAIGVLPDTSPNISDGMTVFPNSANGGRFGVGRITDSGLAYGESRFRPAKDPVASSPTLVYGNGEGIKWPV